MNIIIIFIIILIIFCIICYLNKNENFNISSNDPIITKTYTPNILSITQQFPDIKVFENDHDHRMGVDKCIEYQTKHPGNCVEYGITGNAWFFPKNEFIYGNFKNPDEPNQSFIDFPNM